jgi:hypothetical protein
MLQLPELFTPEGMQQLLPSKQHCKAYLSAFASWTKAYAKLLPATAAAGGEELTEMLRSVMDQLSWVLSEIQHVNKVRVGRVALADGGRGCDGEKGPEVEYAATPSSIQLLVLVALGKVIAATAQELVGKIVAASSSSSSSNGNDDDDDAPEVARHDRMCRAMQQMKVGTISANLASLFDSSTSPLEKTIMLGLLHFHCMAAWQHGNMAFRELLLLLLLAKLRVVRVLQTGRQIRQLQQRPYQQNSIPKYLGPLPCCLKTACPQQ